MRSTIGLAVVVMMATWTWLVERELKRRAMNRYPWIMTKPITKPNIGVARPTGRRSRRFIDKPCTTCGWDPIGYARRCPACFTMVERRTDDR